MKDNIEIAIDVLRGLIFVDGEKLLFRNIGLKIYQGTFDMHEMVKFVLPRRFLRNKKHRLSHKLAVRKKINRLCE